MANIAELVYKANELAEKCVKEKKIDQAVKLYAQAIKLDPQNTKAIGELATIYMDHASFDTAEKILIGAINLSPDNPIFYFKLGRLYNLKSEYELALKYFFKTKDLDPSIKEIYLNLSYIYIELKKYTLAIKYAEEGLEKYPDFLGLLNNVAFSLRALGENEKSLERQKEIVRIDSSNFEFYSNYLLYLSQEESVPPDAFLKEAMSFCKAATQDIKCYKKWPRLSDNKKIRIGFVSGDYRNHPVTFFIEGWLGLLNADEFETIAYSVNLKEDDKTEKLKKIFTEWNQVHLYSNSELARKIYKDNVNILIDLSGHTAHNRLPAFAFKPSPIQISWIGFPMTTGMDQIDYLMPNRLISPESLDKHCVEKIWPLVSAGCLAAPDVEVDVDTLPFLKNGYITFGSFHSLIKITDSVIDVWSRVLIKTPKSKLFFKCKELNDENAKLALKDKFVKKGVDGDRLIFEASSPLEKYFQSYNRIDIGLDPFPYNSGTVGYHSLWMGVPYVSLKGDRMISRIGYSNLSQVGLDDFVADNLDQYEEIAINCAMQADKLVKIRNRLREVTLNSGLFNCQAMANDLERSFREMWHLFLKK